jgi:hypothetical protein
MRPGGMMMKRCIDGELKTMFGKNVYPVNSVSSWNWDRVGPPAPQVTETWSNQKTAYSTTPSKL